DATVTGVQTCALPISEMLVGGRGFDCDDAHARIYAAAAPQRPLRIPKAHLESVVRQDPEIDSDTVLKFDQQPAVVHTKLANERRSEERRVGKEVKSRV